MLLKIKHETDLVYSEPIGESVVELRMFPRQENLQHRLSFELKLAPFSAVNSYFDWVGNTVHTFTVNRVHEKISIVATSVVETEWPNLTPEALPDTWPLHLNGDYKLWDYLQYGGPIVDSPALGELTRELEARPGTSVGELGQRMIRLINERFEYEKGVTTAASPVTDVLEHRKGVCQDFTHLMIAMARHLKIPARYVSGLLHSDGSDSGRFRGHTQTHAWCEIYLPSTGWLGFDPTNNSVVGENYVKVAIGRDYRDVPPNKGLYRGAGKETIDVRVKTEILSTIPSDLFPEKIAPLTTAIPTGGLLPMRKVETHHQEHSQQQQQEKAGLNQQQQQQQQQQ
ncbi:MAG: transglutaminase family protein [Burkholderiales bacterium]|nr:transglutaminase family protein [Phycisphaerae bacterium]